MIINLLLTGDELMAGDIIDSNSAMIARQLLGSGWTIRRKLTVGDDLPELIEAMRSLSGDCDVLLVNGGLGPTVDDLTAQALAAAAAVPIAEHPAALEHLRRWCERLGVPLNAANLKQALLPEGSDIIANATGSAVGFAMRLGNCLVLCTPGVPRELEHMLGDEILPMLHARFLPGETAVRKFALFGIGESTLQQRISDAIPDWPQEVELGFRAGFPQLDLKLTTKTVTARARVDELLPRLQPLVGDFLIGENDIHLPARLVQLLAERGARLTTAESCTGGDIAATLTQVPGASQVFDAGFVTYSNAIKQQVLGVDASVLASAGAVSEAVVLQMAAGALRISGADYAIAVSGIAGPDGGSAEKPVGTVWIAWGARNSLRAQCLHVRFPRQQFQKYVSYIGLDLIRRTLQGITSEPPYFRIKKA